MTATGNIIKGLLMHHYLSLFLVLGAFFLISFIMLAFLEKAETYYDYSLRPSFVKSIIYILEFILFLVVLLSSFAFFALFICNIPKVY